MVVRALVASLVFISASVTSVAAQQAPVSPLGLLGSRFERNAGQAAPDAEFVAHGSGFDLLLTRSGAVVRGGGHRDVRLDFTGGALTSMPIGELALPGVVNYLVGNDPSRWRTNIATFERVRYADVYPGIDVVYHASQGQMEYDVVLEPGADPRRVRMRFAGADRVALESTGDLAVHVGDRVLTVRKPVLYQGNGDSRRSVDGAFVRLADGDIGFDVGRYDSTAPLVIDPVLMYSSYLPPQSTFDNFPAAINVSSDGATYIMGTGTGRFAGFFHTDIFVAKVNPAGSSLAFVTYIGGTDDDTAKAMALGPSGAVYLAGLTASYDFPVASAAQAMSGGGVSDGFLAKLAATGDALEFATFAGGSSTDGAEGLAVDGDENVFLVGSTFSPNFPILASPRAYGGNREGFVVKYDASGAMLYSIFLGGGSWNEMHAARMAPDGTLVVAGETASQSFPVTPGAFDTTHASGFVARLRAVDGSVLQATFLGGTSIVRPSAVDVDASNAVYVTGSTSSTDFPTTAGAVQATHPGGANGNAFAMKLNATLSALVYSTYLGGSNSDSGTGIAADALGQAVVTGSVQSNNFPQFSPLFPYGGGTVPPGFITKLSANGTQFVYSTYWPSTVRAVTVGPSGDAYVTGIFSATTFTMYPTTPAALSAPASIGAGAVGGVWSRISDASPACTYQVHPPVFVAAGSSLSAARKVSVVAPSECFWTVTSDDPTWLTPLTTNGTGLGGIPLVLSDLAAGSRTGTITVGNGSVSQTVTVIQRVCSISAAAAAVQPATGGQLVVSLTGTAGCPWTSAADASWITVTPTLDYLDGAGQAQLTLTVAPNPDITSRNAFVYIGDTARSSGTQIQIQQAGRCTAALSSLPFGAHRTGSSTLFTVSVTPPDCQWTAKSDVSWLVPAVSSGVGSQTISVTASANMLGVRSGNLVIAGQAVSLQQQGPSFSQIPRIYPPSPASGSGHAQTFTFTFYDSNGGTKLDVVNVLFNNFLDGSSACYLAYARASNVLYLVNDPGNALLPGLVLNGGSQTVGNSQCEIDGSGSSAVVTGPNNNSLVLKLKMAFSAQFEGNKVVYQAARNVTGFNSGWVQQGVWNVPAQIPPPLEVRSLTTARNSGSGYPFQFTFRNLAGADQLVSTSVLINAYLDGGGGCYLGYHVPTNSLLLLNDAGNGYLAGITLGDNSTIENSQCRIKALESGAQLSGTDLTLNLMIEFKAGFAGDRVFYVSAQDSVSTSGWQAIGSWTVP